MPDDEVERILTGIAFRGIQADAYFSVRLVRELDSNRAVGGYVSHLMSPWWSLYLHEGRRVLKRRLPQLYVKMDADAEKTFAVARHGVKMFLDSHRDVERYESYFGEIAAAHQRRFLGNAPQIFRRFERDLGVTTYRGSVVTTTHGVGFSTGLEPEAVLRADFGQRLNDLWREGGKSFAMAALAVDGPPTGMLAGWERHQFVMKDVKSEQLYPSIFAGEKRPFLNAVLLHYLGMVNVADLLLPSQAVFESDEYSIFKIRYLTTAHILGSLKKLDQGALPIESRKILNQLINDVPTPRLVSSSWFRNLLVHYEPNPESRLREFNPERLLDGVARVANLEIDVDQMVAENDANLRHLAEGMNVWMSVPRP